MFNFILTPLLKLLVWFSKTSKLGGGSTWPGHIMLSINPHFLHEFGQNYKGKIIVVAGTNGKTTTSLLLRGILERSGKTVIHNKAGANLLNGIASSIIDASLFIGTLPDFAIFEIDENSLPLLLHELTPDVLVILNLFRDQLDRYGEVNSIALKWNAKMKQLPKTTKLILNADDPQVAFLGKGLHASVSYFGIDNKKKYLLKIPHATDILYCPNCQSKLVFEGVYIGHLGKWKCSNCDFKRPAQTYSEEFSALPGLYNIYNTQAATLVAKTIGIDEKTIALAAKTFSPAFGRQEEFVIDGKKVKIFLSKNPTGFNESLRTVKELGAKQLLLVLNDRIPDGRDVSWIWDVDVEEFIGKDVSITVSGDRCWDMGLRLKYGNSSKFPISNFQFPMNFQIEQNLKEAIAKALEKLPVNETLYILPTYSAMLEVRKILGGRKIL